MLKESHIHKFTRTRTTCPSKKGRSKLLRATAPSTSIDQNHFPRGIHWHLSLLFDLSYCGAEASVKLAVSTFQRGEARTQAEVKEESLRRSVFERAVMTFKFQSDCIVRQLFLVAGGWKKIRVKQGSASQMAIYDDPMMSDNICYHPQLKRDLFLFQPEIWSHDTIKSNFTDLIRRHRREEMTVLQVPIAKHNFLSYWSTSSVGREEEPKIQIEG